MNMIQNIAGVNAGFMKPRGIVIHNDAGSVGATAAAYSNSIPRMSTSQLENGFAHFYIDRDTQYQAMWMDRKAWHTANSIGNGEFIGYEVCQSMGASDMDYLANEEATLRKAAQDMKELGIPVNRDTVRLHKSFSATACPHRSVQLHGDNQKCQDYFIERIKYFQNGGTTNKPIDQTTNLKAGVIGVAKVNYTQGYGINIYVKPNPISDNAIPHGNLRMLHGTSWNVFEEVNGMLNLGGNQWIEKKYANFNRLQATKKIQGGVNLYNKPDAIAVNFLSRQITDNNPFLIWGWKVTAGTLYLDLGNNQWVKAEYFTIK